MSLRLFNYSFDNNINNNNNNYIYIIQVILVRMISSKEQFNGYIYRAKICIAEINTLIHTYIHTSNKIRFLFI